MLEIVIGPMYSGKTTFLLDKIKCLEKENKKYLVINHYLDTRYNVNSITNHNQISVSSVPMKKISELLVIDNISQYDYILIDESQFFDDLESSVILLLEQFPSLNILCVGLDGDYEQKPFNDGQLLKLIPKADNLIKLYSKCYHCNEKASFTKRIIEDKTKIIIASNGVYVPCCFRHLKV